MPATPVAVPQEQSREVAPLTFLTSLVADYPQRLAQRPLVPTLPTVAFQNIRKHLRQFDFTQCRDLEELMQEVADIFGRWNLQVPHSGYPGLLNPTPSLACVAVDALVALYNP
jgi:hypothetical protein